MATNGKLGAQPDRRSGEHRSQNLPRQPPRPRIEVREAAASPEEAAAIAAAIEQFLRDTAPAPVAATGPAVSPWLRAGFMQAGLDPAGPSPWGDGEPWGR